MKNNPGYSKELVYAVKYLMMKGFNTKEISRRLDVSPNTVRTVKYLLRKGGEKLEKRKKEEVKKKPKKVKSKEPIDILRELLGEK